MAFEGYRTRARKLASSASRLAGASDKKAPFSLAFLTDLTRIPHPELVVRALPSGAAVIVRDYRFERREALARRLLSVCRSRGARLLVGADEGLARRIGADGVHLPQWKSRAGASGQEASIHGGAPDRWIVSRACHNARQLACAGSEDCDVALLSPVFETDSHWDAMPLGVDEFRRLAASARLPVLALGGVDERCAPVLAGPGVAGLAAIGAFLPAAGPPL